MQWHHVAVGTTTRPLYSHWTYLWCYMYFWCQLSHVMISFGGFLEECLPCFALNFQEAIDAVCKTPQQVTFICSFLFNSLWFFISFVYHQILSYSGASRPSFLWSFNLLPQLALNPFSLLRPENFFERNIEIFHQAEIAMNFYQKTLNRNKVTCLK